MVGNLGTIASPDHESAQRSVRNQGGRANGVSGFFIIVIVIARRSALECNSLLGVNRETVWRVAQEDVCDFFHQGRAISLMTVSGIENHQFPPVRQGPRARTSRPLIRSVTQQVRARFR